jgi:hypothetical protein
MPTPKKHSKETLKVVHPPTVRMSCAEDWKRWVIPGYVWSKWQSLGLVDDDLQALEICVMMNPKGSPVIPGTGGLRKCRFAVKSRGRGKSGAYRIGYVYFEKFGVIGLLAVYAKNDQVEIPMSQRAEIKKAINILYRWISNGG